MNHSVRSLLPSLLLIGIYFIADEFFGTVTGVWVAFLLGGAEFIYTRIREKVYDKMILLTTLFFCIPGLISIWANGSVLSQLQPAIIETALCLLLGFFAFSHTDFTHTLPAGYRKNIHLSGPQLQSMRKMLRILFILVALHTLLAYTAILFLPEDTAKFITTPLLYIILGTYFVVFFIYNRLLLRKMKKEEWLPIVDEKGEVTGQAPPQHLSFGIQTTPSRRTFTHYQRSPRTIPAKKKYEKRPSARYVGYRSRRTYRRK